MGQFLFVSLGLLVVALSLRGVKGSCCPPSWLPINELCYKVFEEQKNWEDAEMFCRKHKPGCHLASIHGQEESDDLAKHLTAHLRTKTDVWIGLHDPNKTRTWEWSDRSHPNYFNWNTGEPNNAGGNEYCVQLRAQSGFKNWNDIRCDIIFPFICQCRY
ncbi:C-type lectin mannose-binding isoform-like [Thamnophis elegans]|uniref:C-type lectin mannose-binding isoform-like n=1 Tax=Thamnophis elegans TaxID=35005 RepID=UPI0013766205|nr:C-type lectin mannose-binding isoform-like [Thamnophis elegans]